MYSDGNEHDLEWFDTLFADVEVAEENYAEESALGLYTYIGAFPVPAGAKRISFEYRNDGQLLKKETVPILQWGKQGARGLAYLGAFSVPYNGSTVPYTQNPPADVDSFTDGDFFLDIFDGYIYVLHDLMWSSVKDYSDSRYNQAMNDMIANCDNTTYPAQFLGVVNIWVKNLTAQTALINQLFAKEITLQEGGVIKSSNYNGTIENGKITEYGNTGFALDSDGNTDINGTFHSKAGFETSNKFEMHIRNDDEVGFLVDRMAEIFGESIFNADRTVLCSGTIKVSLKTSNNTQNYINLPLQNVKFTHDRIMFSDVVCYWNKNGSISYHYAYAIFWLQDKGTGSRFLLSLDLDSTTIGLWSTLIDVHVQMKY